MAVRVLALCLLPAFLLSASSKKNIATARGENDDVSLEATLYIDGDAVKELIGNDLGGHYIVAEIKVTPKYGKVISIDRDDFVLHTDKDGERAQPFVGSQIAGQTALIINGEEPEKKKGGGWTVGGPVLMGSPGMPADHGPTGSTVKTDDHANPLKALLDSKILPEKKTDQPVSGLLYFPMEKQKMKDLEIYYGPKDDRITLQFR
ncbi:MAG TPA: hypothetical protein VME43_04225 [Bryobacteraceae bacterium]|nr:hypothetical protein [Bryobacteraceae bacterium]